MRVCVGARIEEDGSSGSEPSQKKNIGGLDEYLAIAT